MGCGVFRRCPDEPHRWERLPPNLAAGALRLRALCQPDWLPWLLPGLRLSNRARIVTPGFDVVVLCKIDRLPRQARASWKEVGKLKVVGVCLCVFLSVQQECGRTNWVRLIVEAVSKYNLDGVFIDGFQGNSYTITDNPYTITHPLLLLDLPLPFTC